ncbi:MAG TPA: pyridoxamine kinase [Candidatus Acidoferrum sp.]|nr:pyridoxamine kinase [Candidatus Acidoferrum sp.]
MSYSLTPLPRVAAIHDISGFGRCALTVVIPAMSALGIQVCPVPTALLSTHTGGFTDFVFHDLSADIRPTFDHWAALDIRFDCIYSGFLGSYAQLGIVKSVLEEYPHPAMRIVDPVMGDDGALYSTYTREMAENMRVLVGMADLATPNFTECCILTGRRFSEGLIDEDEALRCAKELAGLGVKTCVLTGLNIKEGYYTNLAYESETGKTTTVHCPRLPGCYPGTGDLFTAVLGGLRIIGYPLEKALKLATEYLSETIALTGRLGAPVREGVALERTLPALMRLAK